MANIYRIKVDGEFVKRAGEPKVNKHWYGECEATRVAYVTKACNKNKTVILETPEGEVEIK